MGFSKYEIEKDVWTNSKSLKRVWKIISVAFVKSPLAEIPPKDYVSHNKYSEISIKWLEWESRRLGKPIRHTLNSSGEYMIPNTHWKVDGYLGEGDQKTEWEF